MIDWSELHVQIQPAARDLYEAMSHREWSRAERLAQRMQRLAEDIRIHALRASVRSGEGKAPVILYE